MRTKDELKAAVDKYIEDIPDVDDPTLWSNPDVPAAEEIAERGGTAHFDCPYVDPSKFGAACSNDFKLKLGDDPEENLEGIISKIEAADGTLRCDECGEPIYGFRDNGDH